MHLCITAAATGPKYLLPASCPVPLACCSRPSACSSFGQHSTALCCFSYPLCKWPHSNSQHAAGRCSLVVRSQQQEKESGAPTAPEVLSGQTEAPPSAAAAEAAKATQLGSTDSAQKTVQNARTAIPMGAANSDTCTTSTTASGRSSPAEQAKLLKQLLQLSSISSTDSIDGDLYSKPQLQQQQQHQPSSSSLSQGRKHQQQPRLPLHIRRSESRASSMYDDASAEDYDPMLLDLMGFTSVAQYLQYKLDLAVMQAKVDVLHASVWLSLGGGFMAALGGLPAYSHYVRDVTADGSASDNLTFAWLFLLGYYAAKGCVMSVATGWRAWAARAAEPEMLQDLEAVERQHQRLAYWMLQERLMRYENRANRTYTEFTLACLLLGMLLLMNSGADDLQLQLDTVNQPALSGLLVMMCLFWESYFASIGALVQVVQLASAWVNKIQHKQKWERD